MTALRTKLPFAAPATWSDPNFGKAQKPDFVNSLCIALTPAGQIEQRVFGWAAQRHVGVATPVIA